MYLYGNSNLILIFLFVTKLDGGFLKKGGNGLKLSLFCNIYVSFMMDFGIQVLPTYYKRLFTLPCDF